MKLYEISPIAITRMPTDALLLLNRTGADAQVTPETLAAIAEEIQRRASTVIEHAVRINEARVK